MNIMESTEKLYTLTEVEEKLQVTRQSLYNWIRDGKLKAIKFGGNYRISESAINEFIKM